MKMTKNKSFIITDKSKIIDFVAHISEKMATFMDLPEHRSSKFVLFYKYVTHSDLPTFGKSTDSRVSYKERLKANLLYYPSVDEMYDIENKTNSQFPTTKQSNIGLKKDFYRELGLHDPRDNGYILDNVFLVNDTLKYFTSKYTERIFQKTNKDYLNKIDYCNLKNLDIDISEGDFTQIKLNVAAHGIGTSDNLEFHKLRHHIFKGDTLIIIGEKTTSDTNLYLMVEKNPMFFSILGIKNDAYLNYLQNVRKQLVVSMTNKDNVVNNVDIEDEVTRAQQGEWRKMLAKEMMGYTQNENEVFCPFTYIGGDFYHLSPLFIASHIKGFKDENTSTEEKYDINNGLLLSSNADKLFDKHLISINEKKELVFSFLLADNHRLKQQLLLCQPIFTAILNDKRMEYLKYHKSIFDKKEKERESATFSNYEDL